MNASQLAAGAPLSPAMPWHARIAARRVAMGLPQSLMVVGRRGDGLERLCLHLAESEIVRDDEAGRRLVESGNHPDLHVVRLEESSTGKLRQNIVIGQVRGLLEATSLTPVKAHVRVAVIVPACHMNTSAANALLKNLEEPNDTLRFVLGCENPSWLPITVRSRCQRMVASRPSEKESLAWLEGEGVADAAEALALANGAPLHAMESKDLLPARKELSQILTGDRRLTDPKQRLDTLPIEDWLPWAVGWAARGARMSMGLEAGNNGSAPDVAGTICARHRPAPLDWLDLYNELVDLMRIAHHPVNKRLLLEHVSWSFAMLAKNAR